MSRCPSLAKDAAAKLKTKYPGLRFRFENAPNDTRTLTHVKRVHPQTGAPQTDWVSMLETGIAAIFPEIAPLLAIAKPLVKKFVSKHREEWTGRDPEISETGLAERVAVQPGFISNMRHPLANRAVIDPERPVRLAKMPSPLSVDRDVPVLHGENMRIHMHEVKIERTENHAAMSGSEYLTQLNLLTQQTAQGLTAFMLNLNPRLFAGRRLAVEAKTWQMFRFRKCVIEYVPIQGSMTTGSFIGYFTNDPTEPQLQGEGAIYNAIEHAQSVMFQPFFQTVWALPHDGAKSGLFYCHNDPDGDNRLEIQAVFKIINNVLNSANIPFGSLIMHYEIDFYYPELVVENVPIAFPSAFAQSGGAPQVSNPVYVYPTTGTWPVAVKGTIYQAVISVIPANGANCQYQLAVPTGPFFGQTVFLRQMDATNLSSCAIYGTLAGADNGGPWSQLTFAGTMPATGAVWGLIVTALVGGAQLDRLRTLPDIEDIHRDARSPCSPSGPDPLPSTPQATASALPVIQLAHLAIADDDDPATTPPWRQPIVRRY